MTASRALVAKKAVWGRRNGAYIRQPKTREEVILDDQQLLFICTGRGRLINRKRRPGSSITATGTANHSCHVCRM